MISNEAKTRCLNFPHEPQRKKNNMRQLASRELARARQANTTAPQTARWSCVRICTMPLISDITVTELHMVRHRSVL